MSLMSDPWCDWPDGYPYDSFSAEVGPDSSLDEIRETFADLLADELVDDTVRESLRVLEIVGRRLGVDLLLYDEDAIRSLEDLAAAVPETFNEAPINERIPLSWDM